MFNKVTLVNSYYIGENAQGTSCTFTVDWLNMTIPNIMPKIH